MNNKRPIVIFGIICVTITLITFILSFINSAFIPACLLWLSLFFFDICYYIKDDKKKKQEYIFFSLGVILIVLALIYTITRVL